MSILCYFTNVDLDDCFKTLQLLSKNNVSL
jgi:hypothetical protein